MGPQSDVNPGLGDFYTLQGWYNPHFGAMIKSVLLFLLALSVVLFLPNRDTSHWVSAPSANAQSETNSPLTITEFDEGILIEWTLPPEITVNAEQPFLSFIEAGWTTDRLDDVLLPGATLPLRGLELDEEENEVPTEEIIALVDVLASQPVTLSIDAKEMPSLVGPSGKELPFVSPLSSPNSLVPSQPVYILREGTQRGQRQFVVAVSPIYRDGNILRMATKGMATLVGVTLEQRAPEQRAPEQRAPEQRAPEPAARLTPNNQGGTSQIPANRVGPAQDGQSALIPHVGTNPADKNTNNGSSIALTSPLANPIATSQMVPLNSPLATPTIPTDGRQLGSDNQVDSSEEAAQQSEIEELSEVVMDETTESTELPNDATAIEERTIQLPKTPWTGLLTFAFFGLALVYILFSGER